MTTFKLRYLRRVAPVLVLALAASAAHAQRYDRGYRDENELRISLGQFTPRGDSSYWHENQADFTGSNADDFQDGIFTVDFRHQIAPQVDLSMGGSYFSSSQDESYRNFVDSNGHDIFHTTQLDIATFNIGLVLRLAPRHAPIIPYIGAGASAYTYRLEERGDFIDFDSTDHTIFRTTNSDQHSTLGYYGVAGVDIPLGRVFKIFVEGRYQEGKDDLRGDFRGLGQLDLSGRVLSAGMAWRF